ncbi:MAG: glycerophosphodiester phosphodiesterase [Pseudomonadota bacterium]
MPTSRPVVIAHRGASAYLPEHTLAAKALAFGHGADYLEQDLVASRDNALIVTHDIHLDRISDVATRFPGRCRADGRYYVRDFDLAELRQLSVSERVDAAGKAVYPQRFPVASGRFGLHTFDEELDLVEGLSRSSARRVGIYPEVKRPQWHHEEGVDLSRLLLNALGRRDLRRRTDPVFVQCFDFGELSRWRHEFDSELPLVQLLGENDWNESPTDFDWARTEQGLADIASVADALGPWIGQLVSGGGDSRTAQQWVMNAKARGLALHPYTLRSDDIVDGFRDFADCLHWLIDIIGIDGVFTDFPDTAVELLSYLPPNAGISRG